MRPFEVSLVVVPNILNRARRQVRLTRAVDPLATPKPSRSHAGRYELSVGLITRSEDAVADLQILERDRLAVLRECRLVVDHDGPLALPRVLNLQLIALNRSNLAEGTMRLHLLETLHVFFRHAPHRLRRDLVVVSALTRHHDAVAGLQVFQVNILLVLAIMRLIADCDSLRGTVLALHLEAVNAYGSDGPEQTRAASLGTTLAAGSAGRLRVRRLGVLRRVLPHKPRRAQSESHQGDDG